MASQPFIAMHDGKCAACGDFIEAGVDLIVRTGDGRYVHAEECVEEWEG